MVVALPVRFGHWEVSAVVFLGGIEVVAVGRYWRFFAAELLLDWKPVDEEAWVLGIHAEGVPESLEVVYLEAWGFEVSVMGVFVSVEPEDAEAGH